MSRIGKNLIILPKQVKVNLDGQKISVEGPKGSLSRTLPSLICCVINQENGTLTLQKAKDTQLAQSLYGLSRTLVSNMVVGVSEGFNKKLQLTGVGYRAQVSGNDLVLNIGFSHPVKMVAPTSVSVKCETPTTVVVSGIEKDLVGEFAAKIRAMRPPEPYKGKGIAYEGEIIRRKSGKTGK